MADKKTETAPTKTRTKTKKAKRKFFEKIITNWNGVELIASLVLYFCFQESEHVRWETSSRSEDSVDKVVYAKKVQYSIAITLLMARVRNFICRKIKGCSRHVLWQDLQVTCDKIWVITTNVVKFFQSEIFFETVSKTSYPGKQKDMSRHISGQD